MIDREQCIGTTVNDIRRGALNAAAAAAAAANEGRCACCPR